MRARLLVGLGLLLPAALAAQAPPPKPANAGPAAPPSSATAQIRVGQTATGALTAADSLYPDNTYYRVYQFTAPPGRDVTIDLASDDFDPVLIVMGEGLGQSIIDDDGGPGCAARVSRQFTAPGPYRILVNTTSSPERQTGRYALTVRDGAQPVQERGGADCPSAMSAAAAAGAAGPSAATDSAPGAGGRSLSQIAVGETRQGSLSAGDVLLSSDSTYAQAWLLQGRAGQTVTIDLESDDFDAFLFLRGPGIAGGRDFQDDDGGGGCNARLTATFPQTGAYEIVVNTTGTKRATGSFTLSVTSGSKPKSVKRCSRDE